MSNTFGSFFRVTTFGESHGAAVGAVVDGVPPGMPLENAQIQRDLDRRRPGTSAFVSPRKEPDRVEILSGISDGKTNGASIALLVRNRDVRSSDYSEIRKLFRPGHADYTYFKKYGIPPQPGGGRSSGRETIGRVAAGAVAREIIRPYGIEIFSYTISIGNIKVEHIVPAFAEKNPLRCADPDRVAEMEELVASVSSEEDSIGGVVEVVIHGAPTGLGDPVFGKLDGYLAGAMLSIGAVKGIEFGAGFGLAKMKGSEANDQITADSFVSNNAGGTLGGISTGQPIVMRLAVKPTSSIGKPQSTIDIQGNEQTIQVKGRHDPCLCPRIGPVAEAMAALVVADRTLAHKML
jgi:chorismate synthase